MRYARLFIFFLFTYSLSIAAPAIAAFPVKASVPKKEQKENISRLVRYASPVKGPVKYRAVYGITSFLAGLVADALLETAVLAEIILAVGGVGHVNPGFLAAGLCFSIAAVVLGVIGMNRKYKLKGLAIAGFILGLGCTLAFIAFMIG